MEGWEVGVRHHCCQSKDGASSFSDPTFLLLIFFCRKNPIASLHLKFSQTNKPKANEFRLWPREHLDNKVENVKYGSEIRVDEGGNFV